MIDIAEDELIKNKGAVVNVSSVAAIIPSSTWGIYGVVKAAQDKLTTNLAFMVRTLRCALPVQYAPYLSEGLCSVELQNSLTHSVPHPAGYLARMHTH